MDMSGGESCLKTSRPAELKINERQQVKQQDEPACCNKDVRRRVNINDESASVVIMVKKR